jgi:hypothetical protein
MGGERDKICVEAGVVWGGSLGSDICIADDCTCAGATSTGRIAAESVLSVMGMVSVTGFVECACTLVVPVSLLDGQSEIAS